MRLISNLTVFENKKMLSTIKKNRPLRRSIFRLVNRHLSISPARVKSRSENAVILNYKIVNTVLLIIIAMLCGEIYLLTEKISEMNGMIQSLTEKISKIEEFQKVNIDKSNVTIQGNSVIAGAAGVLLGIMVLMYFGGIDPGSLGNALNISANQATQDLVSQNNLINQNLIDCIKNINYLNKSVIAEIGNKTDFLCSKINIVIKSVTNSNSSGPNIDTLLRSIESSTEDFE